MPLIAALLKDGVITLDDDVDPKTKFYARPLERDEQLIYLHSFTPESQDVSDEEKAAARSNGMEWTFKNQIGKVENAAIRKGDGFELVTLTDSDEIYEFIKGLPIGDQLEIDNKISDLNGVPEETKKKLADTFSAPASSTTRKSRQKSSTADAA